MSNRNARDKAAVDLNVAATNSDLEAAKLSRSLTEFQDTARRLNEASDSINTTIAGIERVLIEANAGLEVWLPQPILTAEVEDGSVEDEHGDSRLYSRWTEYHLGFRKLSQTEGWRLASRVQELTNFQARDEDEQELLAPGRRTLVVDALWKAPRNVRIAALKSLPELVDLLRQAAADAVKAIERAAKMTK